MASSPRGDYGQRRDLAEQLVPIDLQTNRAGFVGFRLFPVLEVALQADTFKVSKLEDLLQKRQDDSRAEDGTYRRGNGKFGKDTYATVEHGWEERVDRREATRWKNWEDAEQMAAERARNMVLQNHEARVVEAVMGITNTTSIVTPWTTHATATPVDDVMDLSLTVRNHCGRMPNALCLELEVFKHLIRCAQMIERIESSGAGRPSSARDITAQMVATALDLEEVIISGGMENTANEAKDAVLSPLWPRAKALLFVRDNNPNVRDRVRIGNTFHWGEDGSTLGQNVEMYYSDERRSDIVRDRMDTDEKLIYPACGQLLLDVWEAAE